MSPNETNLKTINVLIADDHVLYRAGVKMALSGKKDIKIVAEASNVSNSKVKNYFKGKNNSFYKKHKRF